MTFMLRLRTFSMEVNILLVKANDFNVKAMTFSVEVNIFYC